MFDFIFELIWCSKIAKMVPLLILSYRFYLKMTKINLNSISIMNSEHLRITAYICVYLYSLPAAFLKGIFMYSFRPSSLVFNCSLKAICCYYKGLDSYRVFHTKIHDFCLLSEPIWMMYLSKNDKQNVDLIRNVTLQKSD